MIRPRPAQILMDAPATLAHDFAGPGYHVQILVTRAAVVQLDNDPGADAMPIDAPFGPEETKALRGILAAYEADAK